MSDPMHDYPTGEPGPEPSTRAVFWSCLDPEQLSLESPEEAIEEVVDRVAADSIQEAIAKVCPLTVKGYAPNEMDMDWVASLSERAVEHFEESIQDEYGDPDGDSLIEKNKPALTKAIAAAFRAAVQGVTPWSCAVVETRVYTAAEVEAILREECPEWFEVEEPTP